MQSFNMFDNYVFSCSHWESNVCKKFNRMFCHPISKLNYKENTRK